MAAFFSLSLGAWAVRTDRAPLCGVGPSRAMRVARSQVVPRAGAPAAGGACATGHPMQESPSGSRAHERGRSRSSRRDPVAKPGVDPLVSRRYPDGVVALWDERNRRVLFLQLQEAFDWSWRPALSRGRGETS